MDFPPRGYSAFLLNPGGVHCEPTRISHSKNIYYRKRRKCILICFNGQPITKEQLLELYGMKVVHI